MAKVQSIPSQERALKKLNLKYITLFWESSSHLVERQYFQAFPLATHIRYMVDVGKQILLHLSGRVIIDHCEAWQEGAGVVGRVDQAVDDVVTGRGYHRQLHLALTNK